MNRIGVITTLLALTTVASCSQRANKSASESGPGQPDISQSKKISSVDVVRAAAAPTEIAAGASGETNIHLVIQPGYHVNANPPTYPYLKATQLEIAPSEGLLTGPVSYPKALVRKFPFAEKPLAVYEGEIDLKVPLKAEPTAAKSQRSITAKLRVQACDEEVCYPPGALDVIIPVTIR
jgi:hypothetical protein